MKTLYDLLGALPDDDAEGLRAAFRRAAKANHPDLNPGHPELSERFRRIVRANAILTDTRQRETYDRLLEIALRQRGRKQKRGFFSETIHRVAIDAITGAVVSIVVIGGYFAYMSAGKLPSASAKVTELSARETAVSLREPVQAALIQPTETPDAQFMAGQHVRPEVVESSTDIDVDPQVARTPVKPDGFSAVVTTGAAPANAPARDFGVRDASYYRERGMLAYRNGDLYFALVSFDLAIHLDPGVPDTYIDRGIVFHRLGDLKRALSDVAEAKRIDDLNRTKTFSSARAP
jgi:curved DNA-binding protein CbpA